jgi:hypothetical protein
MRYGITLILSVITHFRYPLSCEGGESLVQRTFKLSARISTENPSAIKPILERIIGSKGTIKPTQEGFEVEAGLKGKSSRDLNRMLLSEMRRAEKRTRIRAEWTSGNIIEKYFDYVPKGTRKTNE